ncbi:OPT-domain-containing protein [Apiospora hydei]|uniref:OPT-domain-containing protein n=1 Tax=Apiospora hydei TaxID=1337664 RepID=A0ABR1X515_9PEZI
MATNVDYVGEKPEDAVEQDEKQSRPDYEEKKGRTESPALFPPAEWLDRLKAEYTGDHGGEALPAGADPDRMVECVLTLNEEESIQVLKELLETQKEDYSIDRQMMARLSELVEGCEACGMEQGEWAYEVCKRAGLYHNWSPYTEIRAVTLPYDDPDEACESLRAYFLGFFWVCVCTAINTFFAPRQPGISIPNSVVQLLLVPMGRGLAYVLPDWGMTIRGTRYTLNPGPWTSKEQLLRRSSSRAPRLSETSPRWASFGFNIMLALANQVYGLGMAGILRRLTVYPIEAVWPNVLPTLALNRTLINSDSKREKINGWHMTRYTMFVWAGVVFLVYYWIPNQFFVSLRLFNWMTWISPSNFNLATVTGSYGGMGFNPFSSWDPNVSGKDAMNSPFFAQLQQYVMRALSGLIILIMYYKNAFWAAYMPINSNGAFDNKMGQYNVSKVLDDTNGVDIAKYKEYGPLTMPLPTCSSRFWKPCKKAFVGIVVNSIKRRSVYTGFADGHTRMMRIYKEVPEWWYGLVFLFGFVVSIVSVTAWPTQTPWWSILGVTGVGALLTIPWVVIESIANTGIQLNAIWQVLPGVWFPGRPMPQLIILMLGAAFEQMAGGFSADLKYAHYAKIPPRAVFRGHVSACIVNCFIYCAILEVMMVYANQDSTLCQWDNKQYMVCQYAHSVWSSVIFYGAFGTNNMFKLYPVLPWCFLLGGLLGFLWMAGEKLLPRFKGVLESRMEAKKFASFDRYFWTPAAATMACLNPAIALSGALGWAGNNNLSYATLGLYVAWFFQYFLKRRYTAWWGQVLVPGVCRSQRRRGHLGAHRHARVLLWGREERLVCVVGEHGGAGGVDYQLYNNNASMYPVPAQGYFGLSPEEYPDHW